MTFFNKNNAKSSDKIKLMSQVIALPSIFILLLLLSGIYGQFLGKRVTASFSDIYLKVVSPLVNFQAITSGLNSLTVNLLMVQNTSATAPRYDQQLINIKKSIIQLDQKIEDEIKSAKGRPYEASINKWEPVWEKFYLEIKNNSTSPNYLKNNMPRLLAQINSLQNEMGSIDSSIKFTIGDILENVDIMMANSTKVLTFINVIGLFLGLIITLPLIKRINRLLKKIDDSNKNMETLLNNLDQGFLIYAADGSIYPGATKAVASLFGRDPNGLNLTDILQLETREEKNNLQSWLKILFSGKLPFTEAKQWGPRAFLKENNRFVELDYRPVMNVNSEELEAVICIASDKTQEKAFQKDFEHEQGRLNFIANVAMERDLFTSFVKENRANLKLCKAEAESAIPSVNVLLALLHNIKGNTLAFKMPDNSQLAHELESLLASVLNGQIQMEMIKDQLKKDINQLRADFEGYLIENKEFIGEIDADADTKHIPLRELYLFEKKIKHLYGINSEIHQDFMSYFILEDFSKGFRHFEKVVSELAERFGKNIKVNIQESAIKVCLPEYISLLSSLVHVFRNAVDHGIEEEYAREEVWKKPQAIIDISFNEIMIDDKKHIRVVIADDGQGLDAHLIKQNCLKNGLLKHEELLLINNEEALQLIFCQGLSTAENITDISGRGIGLAAVKYQVELIGGKIWAETKLGHWTKIIFEVPLLMENK